MNARNTLIRQAGVDNIIEFNRTVAKEQRLPHLIVFIDEMNVLVGHDDTELIHYALTQLTALGRAPGVHVIAATQYPNKETIPVDVKNNMDMIVCFHVSNVNASNMLFNDDEAFRMTAKDEEAIPGRAYCSQRGKRYKIQTPFIPRTEKARAIRYAASSYEVSPFSELDRLEDDTAPIAVLPPTLIEKPEFTEDDALAIIVDDLDGRLSGEAVWEIVKDQRVASAEEVRRIVRGLRQRDYVVFDGVQYRVKPSGRSAVLVEETMTQPTDLPPAIEAETT